MHPFFPHKGIPGVMKISSYRGAVLIAFLSLILPGSSVIVGCHKDTNTCTPAVLHFLTTNGLAVTDTALPPGGSLRVSLEADGSDANITYFGVSMNDGQNHYVLDSGMNARTLDYTQLIYKGNAGSEHWTFTVMNRRRQISSISFTISKAVVCLWGAIQTYDPVILGAQSNPGRGGFFSLADGQIFTYNQASADPGLTDIIYYFGSYEATLSSPMESEAPGFFPGLVNWSVRNETRYDTTLLTPAVFRQAQNDSLLLTSYEPVNGKRKAKFLVPGMVVAFRNQAGKAGLLLVNKVTPGVDGEAECTIKVQK